MKFYGLRIYDMAESMVASGFPMLKKKYTPEEWEWEVENLKYWLDKDVMKYLYTQEFNKDKKIEEGKCEECGSDNRIQRYKDLGFFCGKCRHMLDRHGYIKDVHRRTPNKIELFNDRAELITTDNDGNITSRFIIDHEAVPMVIKHKWGENGVYCRTGTFQISLHRILTLESNELYNTDIVVDHINKNTFDNRFSNLRITDNTNNVRNSSIGKNNTSGIVGVSYRKDRNKWRAFIMVDKKQISLGLYENIDQAIKARLEGELKYFGEYAPQLELFEKYGVELPYISNLKHKKTEYNLYKAWKHFKRMCSLGNAIPSSGHDCACKSITVSVNIEADQSFWLQWERYHFQDTVSSMSTMHCLCKFEKIDEMFSKYTDPRSISILNEHIEEYNNNPTSENFHKVIHNCPQGIELCRRVILNYLQIKTMLSQRKNHKMESWRNGFVELTKQLPYFNEFTQTTN